MYLLWCRFRHLKQKLLVSRNHISHISAQVIWLVGSDWWDLTGIWLGGISLVGSVCWDLTAVMPSGWTNWPTIRFWVQLKIKTGVGWLLCILMIFGGSAQALALGIQPKCPLMMLPCFREEKKHQYMNIIFSAPAEPNKAPPFRSRRHYCHCNPCTGASCFTSHLVIMFHPLCLVFAQQHVLQLPSLLGLSPFVYLALYCFLTLLVWEGNTTLSFPTQARYWTNPFVCFQNKVALRRDWTRARSDYFS
jgi:hypothetical protein